MLTEDVPEPPQIDRDNVIIIDEQAVVQSMTKLLGMEKIRDLGDAFITRIDILMKGYLEGRIIFDRYITGSLKESSSYKLIIQDSMNVHNVPMKLLLFHVDTKSQLTEYLG